MPKSTLFNAFRRILGQSGKTNPLPIHSLRHTHAVLQSEAGADMKYLQERLGHGSMEITSDVYSRVSKKIEKRNATLFINTWMAFQNDIFLRFVWGVYGVLTSFDSSKS